MGLGPVLRVVVVVVVVVAAASTPAVATAAAAAPGTRCNGPLGKYTGWSCPCVREAWGGWSAPECTIGISTVVHKPSHLSRRANIIALVEHPGGARRGALENTPTPLAGHLSDLRPRRRDFFGLRVETSWALPHRMQADFDQWCGRNFV